MSKRIIDDVTKSNKKSKHQVTTIITIYYQILCKSQELIENDEIQINARSSLIEMKKKICSSFEGLKPDDILEIIKDESNKKLLSSDDNKILSSLEFNHEDSITIILNPEWMDDEAEKVTEEKTFEVEKILGHKCLSNKKSPQERYVFLVKWKGFDDSYNTFEPVSNLKDNSLFHDYLLKKDKKSKNPHFISFIPKKYL